MKKISLCLIIMFCILTVAGSCKKDAADDTETPGMPRTAVPDAYAGKWMGGSFNMATFDSYDGNRPTNATNMVAYNFKKDGSAEQFSYYNYDDGSDKQVLTYRKGTITFDATTKTLCFYAAEGSYRFFENDSKTQYALNSDGLYPAYAPKYRNCAFEEFDEVTYLVGTNDQNERIGFAKSDW